MAHNGNLGTEPVSEEVHDIRGTVVRGPDGAVLGTVDDVIFDHDTMEIRYLVMDSSGWLDAGTFLLPAEDISVDQSNADGLGTEATREQIESSPQYDEKSLSSDNEWKKYEDEFRNSWEEGAVMHRKDSPDRIITPPEEPAPVETVAAVEDSISGSVVDAAKLFPQRMTAVFSDPTPGGGKVTLRPKSVARAEEAASGVTMLKPRWWEAFENYLRVKKSDIQAKCPQCTSRAA
jgi:sporulation protein YlmC with PRC-barrel domain